MKLLQQLRSKVWAIRKRPEVYVRHYALALVLRGTLIFLEVVLLRLFYVPLRLADLSTREIVQYMRKIDFNVWIWFKGALGKCLEVKSWLQGLGNFASMRGCNGSARPSLLFAVCCGSRASWGSACGNSCAVTSVTAAWCGAVPCAWSWA